MISKIKYFIKVLLRKEIISKVQVNVPVRWYGNKDAGFYVYSKNLNSDSVVYSFGVGEDILFDLQLISIYHCAVFGFDPTPKSVEFIQRNKSPNLYHFIPVAIYKHDGKINFELPENPNHVSCTVSNDSNKKNIIEVPCKKFTTIVEELAHTKIDILKMDIEGAEYDVIEEILESEIQIDQILLEFHHRFARIGLIKTKEAIKKLNNHGYKIAAISDSREEYTFIKTS